MILRQITTCAAPATTIATARSRGHDRQVLYRLGVCHRHRWLAQDWPGTRTTAPDGSGRCGTAVDHRTYDGVVQSHIDLWIRPATTQDLPEHGGSAARLLRAAAAWAQQDSRGEHALAVVLGHAATVAEAIEAGSLNIESGRHQVLAALSAAETTDAALRGA
ncbi:hypothetical protein [Streptomyces sp. NPDC092952]|uniref:hypothetical protein n=1 Tax=Streptomyces sp. NPDC092952 TaxID=3366018 RepID=UPI0038007C06